MNFFPGDGFLVEPNSVIKSSLISSLSMVTWRSRQTIESPGDAGVGRTLIGVEVGCGCTVMVTGVTVSPLEEQAVNMSNPIQIFNRTLGSFFMQDVKVL